MNHTERYTSYRICKRNCISSPQQPHCVAFTFFFSQVQFWGGVLSVLLSWNAEMFINISNRQSTNYMCSIQWCICIWKSFSTFYMFRVVRNRSESRQWAICIWNETNNLHEYIYTARIIVKIVLLIITFGNWLGVW